ncbi:MAG: FAD-dependent monooxygenase [Xanthobacteraceae bacterium]
MSLEEADVVIVGGGPVGMGLAIELGQRDVPCVVVERHLLPQPIPKGQNLTQRTMEHFYFWDVEDSIRAAAPIPAESGIGGLTAYGNLLSEYHYDWYERAVVDPYYFTANERLPQYATEEVLRDRVSKLPSVDVLYGWSAEEITQDRAGVYVTVSQSDGIERRTLQGRYLVGCDGSKSVVREKAGIEQTRSHHDMLMVLLVFRSSQLNQLLERYPGTSFYNVLHPNLEGYWQFFGRVDPRETWFFHAPVPPDTTRDNFDFRKYLHTAVGAEFDCDFTHIGFWDLRIATANTYRNERVFIAGDAAHNHPPYGGYGINTGFEDARNLGWKLAATIGGWGGRVLLDSYTLERQPVFASTAKDFIEHFISTDRKFLHTYHPDRDKAAFERAWAARGAGTISEIRRFEPNYEGSPLVLGAGGGVCSAIGDHLYEARAGHHLAPQSLSSGRNIFERLGEWFSLLAFDVEDSMVLTFEATAKALRIPLSIIRDTFADGREAYGHRLILVRPDQFVVWAGNDMPADISDLLTKAIGGS